MAGCMADMALKKVTQATWSRLSATPAEDWAKRPQTLPPQWHTSSTPMSTKALIVPLGANSFWTTTPSPKKIYCIHFSSITRNKPYNENFLISRIFLRHSYFATQWEWMQNKKEENSKKFYPWDKTWSWLGHNCVWGKCVSRSRDVNAWGTEKERGGEWRRTAGEEKESDYRTQRGGGFNHKNLVST